MTYELPEKFRDYVCAGDVSPNIPDELLKELKEFNEILKKADGREHLHFPR